MDNFSTVYFTTLFLIWTVPGSVILISNFITGVAVWRTDKAYFVKVFCITCMSEFFPVIIVKHFLETLKFLNHSYCVIFICVLEYFDKLGSERYLVQCKFHLIFILSILLFVKSVRGGWQFNLMSCFPLFWLEHLLFRYEWDETSPKQTSHPRRPQSSVWHFLTGQWRMDCNVL